MSSDQLPNRIAPTAVVTKEAVIQYSVRCTVCGLVRYPTSDATAEAERRDHETWHATRRARGMER